MVRKRSNRAGSYARLCMVAGILSVACSERDLDTLGPATSPPFGDVYVDDFSAGLQYHAFGGSKFDALSIDATGGRAGSPSLKFTVPLPHDPSGSYAGGVFVSVPPRDLSTFTALTFWVRASTAATINTVGFANDNSGTSMYTVEAGDVRIGTSWQRVILPVPDPSKLDTEGGMFHLAEGAENDLPNEIWIDELRYEDVRTIANPRPSIATITVTGEVGSTAQVPGTQVAYDVGGEDRVLNVSPAYMSYSSSNPGIVTVNENGLMTFVGLGTATVTATLRNQPAAGAVTVVVGETPLSGPPTPTHNPADVIALFSDAYAAVNVDTWSADWDQADVEDIAIGGDNIKRYSNLVFAGIEFISSPINASEMTHFRFDLWTGDSTVAPAAFLVKLVDFGADGVFGGGDDSEHELRVTASDGLASKQWASIDIPLSQFTGLSGRSNVTQLIVSGDLNTVYLDNIYFRSGGTAPPPPPSPMPAGPAPTPAHDAADVISLFSDAYDDVSVDTWSAEWDQADIEDVAVAGDNMKKYSNLVFAGVEFISQQVNAGEMTHFHVDVWTPDDTADPAVFRVKLVDFGADGGYQGGDDSEHEVSLTAGSNPPLATGRWVSYDLVLDDLEGLTAREHLAQLIFSGDPNTVFLDNIYFWKP